MHKVSAVSQTATLDNRAAPGRNKDEDKGNQILEAAGALFLNEGFSTVSMAQIARHAGVSKQTVYSHYGSKEALLSAAIEKKCADYEINSHTPDYDRPVRDYLHDFAQHFNDLVTSEAGIGIHRICIAEADKPSRIAELFWHAGPEPIKQQLTQYLEEQVKRGRLHIDNVQFAADQLLFMIKSDVHMRGVLGLPTDQARRELPAYLESCLNVFMRAYGVDD